MFCVELSFTDNDPRRLAIRPAHRERLRALFEQGEILASGPWQDDSGALLIFTVDRERLDQILAEDPYYTAPGVEVVSVREWHPVVGPAGPSGS
ncbi:YciI family protein [Micromonospora sp. WMMD812]|uniref:YciI family protein n=1 Tax=Micromonospora sp. WMMD812 TaxID=3015152 RepID=UPI00248C5F2F|nr:YciI family protein [Micromonospora sp. WMMD812]WBB65989.1 YciI family protein [Micromonospora sp. WMMD812]